MLLLKVDISEISLSSKSNRKILSNINFSLETGYIYSILGSNGAGKTTLLLSIANLLNKNIFAISGEIFIGDKNIFSLAENEMNDIRKMYLRYLFQSPSSMFDPLRKMKHYIQMIEDKVYLSKLFEQSLLLDPKTISQKYYYEFSEGQLQRLALCLAMAAKPKLLILDEPTSSLDPINLNIIKNMILAFVNENSSALIVTHDHVFAENISDFIGEIQDGTFINFNNRSGKS